MSAETFQHDELLAELAEPGECEKGLLDLVRLDYDSTLRALSGFVSSAAQIRAVGFASWGVVLGFAVRDESALLAGVALAVILIFACADAYHAALYRQALARAIRLEKLLNSYVERLGIDADNPEAIMRVQAKLENHKFGFHRSLRPLKRHDFLPRPTSVFGAMYVMVAAITAGLVIGYAL